MSGSYWCIDVMSSEYFDLVCEIFVVGLLLQREIFLTCGTLDSSSFLHKRIRIQ